ncbi:MAG: phosphotransferase family protein [Novosphingobium sp.]|nr:phosphotransferase family protein [Novosphingobium sp.]
MSDIIVAPHVRDLDDLARALAGWLSPRLPGASDIRLENLTYPRGAGQSHETILFDAHWREGGEDREQGMVVRIKPTSFTVYPDDLFIEQYRIMQVMHEGGYVPVAPPLWIEEDASLLGSPFFVMEKRVGRVPVSIPPYSEIGWVVEATPDQRRCMWESGVRNLAATQSAPLDQLRFLEGSDHAREGLEQEFDKYTRIAAWVQQERPSPMVERSLAQLKDLWPDNRPPGLVWGDARIGNMMFDEHFEVIAVMDWEQPTLGGALNDLAWWTVNSEMMHGARQDRPHLAGMGTREETVALWQEVSGISTENLEWYEDFTRLKMMCLGIRMATLRGQPPIDEAMLAQQLKVE